MSGLNTKAVFQYSL